MPRDVQHKIAMVVAGVGYGQQLDITRYKQSQKVRELVLSPCLIKTSTKLIP